MSRASDLVNKGGPRGAGPIGRPSYNKGSQRIRDNQRRISDINTRYSPEITSRYANMGGAGWGGTGRAFFPGAGYQSYPEGTTGTPYGGMRSGFSGRGGRGSRGGGNFDSMGMGGGFGSGFGGGRGRPGSVNTYNTLRPEQQDILEGGSGLVNDIFNLPEGANPFMPMSWGDTQSFINSAFRPGAMADFNKHVIPQISESFVGPGTYWGGARAGAESDARAGFENQMLEESGKQFLSDRDRASALLPFATQLAGLNTGITFATPEERGFGGFGGMDQGVPSGGGVGPQGGPQGGPASGENMLEEMGMLGSDGLGGVDNQDLFDANWGAQEGNWLEELLELASKGRQERDYTSGPFGDFDGLDDSYWFR